MSLERRSKKWNTKTTNKKIQIDNFFLNHENDISSNYFHGLKTNCLGNISVTVIKYNYVFPTIINKIMGAIPTNRSLYILLLNCCRQCSNNNRRNGLRVVKFCCYQDIPYFNLFRQHLYYIT